MLDRYSHKYKVNYVRMHKQLAKEMFSPRVTTFTRQRIKQLYEDKTWSASQRKLKNIYKVY